MRAIALVITHNKMEVIHYQSATAAQNQREEGAAAKADLSVHNVAAYPTWSPYAQL